MYYLKMRTVNQTGLEEIRKFLIANHVDGAMFKAADSGTLQAWADDAEFQLAEGNDASIELPARSSKGGYTLTMTVSDAGLDFVHSDDEE